MGIWQVRLVQLYGEFCRESVLINGAISPDPTKGEYAMWGDSVINEPSLPMNPVQPYTA